MNESELIRQVKFWYEFESDNKVLLNLIIQTISKEAASFFNNRIILEKGADQMFHYVNPLEWDGLQLYGCNSIQ